MLITIGIGNGTGKSGHLCYFFAIMPDYHCLLRRLVAIVVSPVFLSVELII
jgi:hypothetical protein